jgi:hypothetical protein
MMGTDALEVAVLHDAINELSKERVVEIVIFTGGDDQSVGVLLLKLRISASTIEVRRIAIHEVVLHLKYSY